MRGTLALALGVALAGLVGPAALASAPSGPVTIVTHVDFTAAPVTGTFEVTEGSGIVGCSSGTLVDSGLQGPTIRKTFTCTSGGSGSFVAVVRILCVVSPTHYDAATDTCSGNWNFSSAGHTGDFVGLHGTGTFTVVVDFGISGVELLTGSAHYD